MEDNQVNKFHSTSETASC